MQALGQSLGNAIRHMQEHGTGVSHILRNLASRPRSSNEGIMAALAPGNDPPPPPPGAGAIVAANKRRQRPRTSDEEVVPAAPANTPPPPPFFSSFGTDYKAPVIQKKPAKYKLADRPRDDDIKIIAGGKRAKPEPNSSVLRQQKQETQRRPPQPPGPRIPERYNIGDDDDSPSPSPPPAVKLGRFAAKLAKHMAAHHKRPKTIGAATSADPWDILFGEDEEGTSQEREQKFLKAVAKAAKGPKKGVIKDKMKVKPPKALAAAVVG